MKNVKRDDLSQDLDDQEAPDGGHYRKVEHEHHKFNMMEARAIMCFNTGNLVFKNICVTRTLGHMRRMTNASSGHVKEWIATWTSNM